MYVYTTDAQEINKNANTIKEVVLNGLQREGVITKEKADEIASKYAIVMHKKGWLGQLWDKWFEGIKEDSFRITFVKIIS